MESPPNLDPVPGPKCGLVLRHPRLGPTISIFIELTERDWKRALTVKHSALYRKFELLEILISCRLEATYVRSACMLVAGNRREMFSTRYGMLMSWGR